MVSPWRTITDAELDAIKVASPVLNGEDEETGRRALRLVLTQLPRCGFRQRLTPSVRRSATWMWHGSHSSTAG